MIFAPQVVPRSDGGDVYRARKGPEALIVELCGFERGILVVRCHDLTIARLLASWESGDLELSRALVAGPLSRGESVGDRIWTRWVPNDYHNREAGGTWERELRGTTGATPAVLFATPTT